MPTSTQTSTHPGTATSAGADIDIPVAGIVAGTTPYPWPYDAELTRHRTALVVLGWSVDWWQLCDDPTFVLDRIASLAAAVDCVITVDQPVPHVHGQRASSSITDMRAAIPGARVVSAVGVDGFFGGPLDSVLRAGGHDLILLVGLGLEASVHSTMRSANDRGYECLLIVDACAPLVPELVPAAISMVEMSGGIFGAVGTTAPVLAALDAAPN